MKYRVQHYSDVIAEFEDALFAIGFARNFAQDEIKLIKVVEIESGRVLAVYDGWRMNANGEEV